MFEIYRHHEEKPGLRTLDEHSQREMTALAVIDDARAFKFKAAIEEAARRGQK